MREIVDYPIRGSNSLCKRRLLGGATLAVANYVA